VTQAELIVAIRNAPGVEERSAKRPGEYMDAPAPRGKEWVVFSKTTPPHRAEAVFLVPIEVAEQFGIPRYDENDQPLNDAARAIAAPPSVVPDA
jgi:hypothetical protein